jgi:4-amino-4-deoxy-L-arabinose transferase-like glycosyltransferase
LAGQRLPLRSAFAPLWFVVIVVFFSLVKQKKIAYLLPVMAAQTLFITQGIMALRPMRRGLQHGAAVVAMIQAIVGLVFAAVLIVLIFLTPSPARWSGLVFGCVGLVLAAVALQAILRRQGTRWVAIQSMAYCVLIAGLLAFYLGPLDNQRSAKPVARKVHALLATGGYTVAVDRLPEEVAVYLPLGLRYEPREHVLAVIDDSHGVRLRRKQHTPPPVPPPEVFRSWASDGKVVAVRAVDIPGITGDSRWKLYDLTVERRALVSAE